MMQNTGKTFCQDCGIRVRPKVEKGLFNKKNDEEAPFEYVDGWRCNACARGYRQKKNDDPILAAFKKLEEVRNIGPQQ